MLTIEKLTATVDGKPILKGIDLAVPDGEVHAIMGPNGSGKSTLSYVLAGREDYEVTGGSASWRGQDLLAMEPEERAAAGLFLAFQYPVELPGVNNANFLRTALNAQHRARGEPEVDAVQFLKLARAAMKKLSMPDDMLKRNVNVGFSGGEKKRNEVLQMAVLRPTLAILDETDSGLDIDALKIVADGVNALRGPDFSALVITHYQRLLDHIVPDRVHVLASGRIIRSGGPELARELEENGYAAVVAEGGMNAPVLNTPVLSGAAGFLARFDTARGQLPGDLAIRDRAAASFRALGIPGGSAGRRTEAWKYTTLRPVAEMSFAAEPLVSPAVPGLDASRLIFVDGRFRADLSRLPDAVTVRCFADAPAFGALAQPDSEPMVALNTMLAEDGAVIDVPDGVDAGTIQIVSLGSGEAFFPRHAIRLGAGASLHLLDISAGEGTYFHNAVTTIELGRDARLVHVRLQNEAPGAVHVATIYAELAAGSRLEGFTLNLGGRLARAETHARLAGPGAELALNGVQLLGGAQHGDITTVVAHDAPRCASRQTVKHVLAGRSRGVFQGRIAVDRIAQKTDGYQMNQALLLSREAEIDCKPELEIFADDVKCSHGATVGELDRNQIFYARARGIPEVEARALLVRAFLTEALDLVSDESFRTLLGTEITRWWEGQGR